MKNKTKYISIPTYPWDGIGIAKYIADNPDLVRKYNKLPTKKEFKEIFSKVAKA